MARLARWAARTSARKKPRPTPILYHWRPSPPRYSLASGVGFGFRGEAFGLFDPLRPSQFPAAGRQSSEVVGAQIGRERNGLCEPEPRLGWRAKSQQYPARRTGRLIGRLFEKRRLHRLVPVESAEV